MTDDEFKRLLNVPKVLQNLKQWVCWQRQPVKGRVLKIPLTIMGKLAAVNKPTTWSDFKRVKGAAYNHEWGGVGLVLNGNGITGIDLDDCLDGGEREWHAFELVKAMGSYCEISPSGKGLHILGYGRKNCTRSKWHDDATGLTVEIYESGRYLTITGNIYKGFKSFEDIQQPLNALTDRLTAQAPTAATVEDVAAVSYEDLQPVDALEVEGLRRKLLANTGAAALYRGELTGKYTDRSRADLALMGQLATLTRGRRLLMEHLFSGSALGQREKWQRRVDYREGVIRRALSYWINKNCPRWR